MPEASLDLLAGEMDEVSYPRGTRILKAGAQDTIFSPMMETMRVVIKSRRRNEADS